MWAQLRRFNSLPRAAKADFLRALLLLPLIRTSLRLRGFRKTQKSLQRYAAAPGRAALSEAEAQADAKQTCRKGCRLSRNRLPVEPPRGLRAFLRFRIGALSFPGAICKPLPRDLPAPLSAERCAIPGGDAWLWRRRCRDRRPDGGISRLFGK